MEIVYQMINHLIDISVNNILLKLRICITGVRICPIRNFVTWLLENRGRFKIFRKGWRTGGHDNKGGRLVALCVMN